MAKSGDRFDMPDCSAYIGKAGGPPIPVASTSRWSSYCRGDAYLHHRTSTLNRSRSTRSSKEAWDITCGRQLAYLEVRRISLRAAQGAPHIQESFWGRHPRSQRAQAGGTLRGLHRADLRNPAGSRSEEKRDPRLYICLSMVMLQFDERWHAHAGPASRADSDASPRSSLGGEGWCCGVLRLGWCVGPG
jgi:hypothetical protein